MNLRITNYQTNFFPDYSLQMYGEIDILKSPQQVLFTPTKAQ